MAISNDQLSTWTNAPGSTKSQNTYQQVKIALSKSNALSGHNYEVYLQGSYANSTNIKLDSDIDIVIQLNSTFQYDLSKLNDMQKSLFHLTYSNATYFWADFRQDVINALISNFGSAKIKLGKKSIKLVGDDNLLNADIVPCLQNRNYNSFDLSDKYNFVEGMKFWTTENKEIINYPRVHKSNGEDKNTQHRTNEKYKDMVRIFKNLRRRMVEDEGFNPEIAPSYFVECTIYNTPDPSFDSHHQTSLINVFEFILRHCDPAQLLTVSHQHSLFGPEPWQWNINDANTFFTGAENYFYRN